MASDPAGEDPTGSWLEVVERRIYEFRQERGVAGVNVAVRLRSGERLTLRSMAAGPLPGMLRLSPAVEDEDDMIVAKAGPAEGRPVTPTERIVLLSNVVEIELDAREEEHAAFGFSAS